MSDIEEGSAAEVPPLTALLLSYAGLIPFVFGAAALVLSEAGALSTLGDPRYFATVLIGYGAVILAFLGGVRWGAALIHDAAQSAPRNVAAASALTRELVIATLPSLVGWGALLLPIPAGLALLAISLAAICVADRIAARDGRLPAWYGRMRLWLTAGAVMSLLVGLVATLIA